jgi:hypothetical protein
MHYEIQQELARAHRAELLRDAEQARLALQVRRDEKRPSRLRSFLEHAWRQRAEGRPVPAA